MPFRHNPALTQEQKQEITSVFARGSGWTPKIPDPNNPGLLINNVSKARWMDLRVDEFVAGVVYGQRLAEQRAAFEQTIRDAMEPISGPG